MKVVLIDDEPIVIKGLSKMIGWSQYGMELAGTASDGNAGLELFYKHRPDVVFTDIRMPGKDGLELIEEVLKAAPDTICIVFSGFNEFEYARKALKLGVTDYLEKPITVSTIKETLEKIQMKKAQNEQWEKSKQIVSEKMALDLILTNGENEEIFKEQFPGIQAVSVLAYTGGELPLESDEYGNVVHTFDGNHPLIVLFQFDHNPTWMERKLALYRKDPEKTIASGRTYKDTIDAHKSYQEALYTLRFATFSNEKGWIKYEGLPEEVELTESLEPIEEAVVYSLRIEDASGVQKALEDYLEKMAKRSLNPNVAEREVLRLIYLSMDAVRETGFDGADRMLEEYFPQIELQQLRTKQQMMNWLRIQMDKFVEWLPGSQTDRKHPAVEKALDYVKKHYGHDVSLEEVADFVGMNPNYFSMLFKEEMGTTYIKYLTQYRIQVAKIMLEQGGTVADVSGSVGYRTYRHFSSTFKKQTGYAPGEYKKIHYKG